VFFLDKDIDDIEKRQKRSPHMVYTPTYDIEGLIFRYGDVIDASAAALSLPRSATAYIGSAGAWCDAASRSWAEWTALCLCSRSLRLGHANFGSTSRVNEPLHFPTDPMRVGAVLQELATAAGLSVATVKRRYKRRLARVQALATAGNIEAVFKGKWYADILCSELRARIPSARARDGLARAVYASLMSRLDYGARWSAPFRDSVSALMTAT
jgi:hypothetical protein